MGFLNWRAGRGTVFGLTLGLATVAASAQGPGGPGGPGGQSLVLSPEVQKDLGLTEKQEAQIKRMAAALDRKRGELFAEEGEQGGDPRERMTAMMGLMREVESSATKTLNKRQKDRLAQLELQREGSLALARKEIAAKVKLTSAQSKKVKTIVDEMRTEMARAMPKPPGGGPDDPAAKGRRRGGRDRGPGDGPAERNEGVVNGAGVESEPGFEKETPVAGEGDPGGGRPRGAGGVRPPGGRPNFDSPELQAQFAKMREVHTKLRATATGKIDELLTADQKAAYEKLLGKPFDFSKIRPGGPGGSGGPGGRDRPGGDRPRPPADRPQ